MTHRILAGLVALAILAPAAPARAANKEHQQLMADLRMLQEQSQILQNMLASLTDLLKTMSAHLEQRLDQQNTTLVKGFADQKVILDSLSNETRVLREKLDDNNVRIGSVTQELEALRQAVQQRPTVTSDPDPLGGTPSAAGGSSPPAGSAPGAPLVALSPQKMQDAAQADYAAGQFDLAIEGFQAYIKNFPKADWADNAQLYICRSYFLDGKPDKAAEACDAVLRNYPTGDAVPDALYQKGVALRGLKDVEGARMAWETVIKNYKDSAAASLAQQALNGLRRP
jgi:tol-pal system protein YbgF